MNLSKMVAAIEEKNGGLPITNADRETIARDLKVKVESIKRVEPRIFSSDVVVSHTDSSPDDDEGRSVTSSGIIAVEGGQREVECAMDQRDIMRRIMAIVETNFEDRDLEIVRARLSGDMTRDKFDDLVEKYDISVERIRQIQRASFTTIKEGLQSEGIHSLDQIAY